MHILILPSEHYVPKESPLSGIFQRDQALALKRAGCQVGVIAPNLRSLRLLRKKMIGWPKGVEVEIDEGVYVIRYYGWEWGIPLVAYGRLRQKIKAGMNLFERYVAERGSPDIIHAHNSLYGGYLASLIKKKFGIPYVITEHSSVFVRKMVRRWEVPVFRKAFANADARIMVSPKLGSYLEKHYGSDVKPWDWIPNILDQKFEKGISLQKQNAHESRVFHFLNIANLNENKCHSDLLDAFSRHFKGQTNTQLRIGGTGPLHNHLERLANNLGISKQVVFLGLLTRDQVLEEMRECDVFVLSSHHETFGVVLIEALSCGKPVIATASGGPECIVNEGNGILVPPRNPDALGQAMLTLRSTRNRYIDHEIRQSCLGSFGEETVIRKLLEIYSHVREPWRMVNEMYH
jgi:glycosyltransferase involved in cell wall biosynthesis